MFGKIADLFVVLLTLWNAVMVIHVLMFFTLQQIKTRRTPGLVPFLYVFAGLFVGTLVTVSELAFIKWVCLFLSCGLGLKGGVMATRQFYREIKKGKEGEA